MATSPVNLEATERKVVIQAMEFYAAKFSRDAKSEPDPEVAKLRQKRVDELLALAAKFR